MRTIGVKKRRHAPSHRGFSRNSLARTEERRRSERLLLITGTPGTGKRVVGNYLVDSRDFVHIDLDNEHARIRFLGAGTAGLQAELEANIEPGQDLVVTWSSASGEQLSFVQVMQSLGFEWIWFDSDRGAVFQDFFARRMRGASVPYIIDAFAADGAFRPIEAVACELLEPRPVVAPQQVGERIAAAGRRFLHPPVWLPTRPAPLAGLRSVMSRQRPAIAWGVGLATTAAAAVGGYFAAGHPGAWQPARVAAAGHAVHAQPPALPRTGVLVAGRSLAGVKLGDTPAKVRATWGSHFTVCDGCATMTWLYVYPTGDPFGASVRFRDGHATGVFTLGSPPGWRIANGLRVGQMLSAGEMHGKSNDAGPAIRWKSCNGYGAKTMATSSSVTSVLTIGYAVYGFALTRPSESVCL